ncbi:MAG: dihydroorotate dehydrogenase-like protein [Granulosicoccaceae bacterium]|jgi:dihydroorotate dehydrogenase (fumarate)
MVDLTTDYLGLTLKNPIVPSSSPLLRELDTAEQLQEAGASALILHSLFEEQIEHEQAHLGRFFEQQALGHAEAESFHPVPAALQSYEDKYLEYVQQLKSRLEIPVIASLNGITRGGWVEYGRALQQAGADALELNVYYVAANPQESAQQVEDRYVDILEALRTQIDIPVCMKLSSQFSALIPFVKRLEAAGAAGVSLFNRFYLPDIDLETLHVMPKVDLSSSMEMLLRIRWVAILYGRVGLSLAITGGVHTHEDVLKGLLSGADITCMCSALLEHGPAHIGQVLQDMRHWLEEREYESVRQLKGSISQQHAINPAAYERVNYLDVLDSYSPSPGVRR